MAHTEELLNSSLLFDKICFCCCWSFRDVAWDFDQLPQNFHETAYYFCPFNPGSIRWFHLQSQDESAQGLCFTTESSMPLLECISKWAGAQEYPHGCWVMGPGRRSLPREKLKRGAVRCWGHCGAGEMGGSSEGTERYNWDSSKEIPAYLGARREGLSGEDIYSQTMLPLKDGPCTVVPGMTNQEGGDGQAQSILPQY